MKMNLFNWIDGENADESFDAPEGIRLHKLEVYNWGTFDKNIWTFTPDGNTSLLTGESGSGKSTIVDALTTLLVSPRKTAYNKAADATARERTAKSYVLGYYGRKYAFEGKGKPEALREQNSYSVLLATFKDLVAGNTTTLGIFFWFKDSDSAPSKLYVVSEKELCIGGDFAGFNGNIKTLRNNLRTNGALAFDDYKHYAENFRKLMGNVTEQAIDLFQQTISMKKVEALNDFVRGSMLEKEDVEQQIDELLKHYHNLNMAYEAVVKAKEQIQALTPISEKGAQHTAKENEQRQLTLARDSIEWWFATKKRKLILDSIESTKLNLGEIQKNILNEDERQTLIQDEIEEVKTSITQNGGGEMERLTGVLQQYQEKLTRRKADLDRYNQFARQLALKEGNFIEIYNENLKKLPSLEIAVEQEGKSIQSRLAQIVITEDACKKEKDEFSHEITSLTSRNSNIPRKLIELREKLCGDLKVNKEVIPFAGELLEVKESEIKWEGAIERLTHSFAISLLVPDEHYGEVASWVNKERLGTKLVYFRVKDKTNMMPFKSLSENTAASKLDVKENTRFTSWLEREIEEKFSHICCEDIGEFKKQNKAITLTGQIKSNLRHEKNDRMNIDDRTRFVLGFSNEKKLEVLNSLLAEKVKELEGIGIEKKTVQEGQDVIDSKKRALLNIRQFDNFNTMDVISTNSDIAEIKRKIAQLQSSNSLLATLKDQLEKLRTREAKIKGTLASLYTKSGKYTGQLEQYKKDQLENEEKLAKETEENRAMGEFIGHDFDVFANGTVLTLGEADKLEGRYNKDLNTRCEKLQNQIAVLKADIEKAMTKFRNEYPAESLEMTESVESINEYDSLLAQLQYHNLPKYQKEFKEELQGKIINHISMFNGILSQYRKNITRRIDEINQSLKEIDYNPGRYITIVLEDTPETDIRNFRNQLKACTEGMILGLDDEVAANKFNQIKEIIQRFKGRSEYVEIDKRWTAKVTDVRNWFIFSASERWHDGDEEYEHYSDSDGKSGGQKEKLAYTILAASLLYNYRLNQSSNYGSSFRLVVIDEAFLKSSDDSAKYGLELFAKMKFQLMVVTPLLKISTIEPFISHVGFVSYSDMTHRSTLKNIPMEVYRKKRQEWEEKDVEDLE